MGGFYTEKTLETILEAFSGGFLATFYQKLSIIPSLYSHFSCMQTVHILVFAVKYIV